MVVLTFGMNVLASELHSGLCLDGCPAGAAPTNDVVVRGIYVLSSNDTTKFADWVAYPFLPTCLRHRQPLELL